MLDQAPQLPQPGDLIDGRYLVDQKIGEGGFSLVYRVRDEAWLRPLALKLLKPQALQDGMSQDKRFWREAAVLAKLSHPHTLAYHAFGSYQDWLPYLVTELLAGRTVSAELLERGPLPAERVIRIAEQLLGALDEAHALQLVHRDLKPDNVFLCERPGARDHAKLIDFGIAKPLGGGNLAQIVKTQAGLVFGTPSFMAPEAWTGVGLGPWTDVYALGLTLAAMLEGRDLLHGVREVRVLMEAQLSPAPLELPPSVTGTVLGPILRRATLKRAGDRYQSAREMLAEIEAISPTIGASASSFPSLDVLRITQTASRSTPLPGPPLAPGATPRRVTPAPPSLPAPGTVLDDRFRVDEERGSTSRHLVFQGTQLSLQRPVWIRVQREALDPAGRFWRELQLAGRLHHPAVARVIDWGQCAGGQPYLVTEYLEGETLAQLLVRGAPLTDEQLGAIGRQVLSALAEAHALGVIHRGLKPANVFLCQVAGSLPQAKLLDFGLAKIVDGRSWKELGPQTRPGELVGAPEYMAPEQLTGRPLDGRTDLYSLGLTLTVARAGRPLFANQALTAVLQAQAMPAPLPLPPEVAGGPLGPVLRRATEKDPDRRYASAAAMLEAFEDALPAPTQPVAGAQDAGLTLAALPASPAPASLAKTMVPADRDLFGRAGVGGTLRGGDESLAQARVEGRTEALRRVLESLLLQRVSSRLNEVELAPLRRAADPVDLEITLVAALDERDPQRLRRLILGQG